MPYEITQCLLCVCIVSLQKPLNYWNSPTI